MSFGQRLSNRQIFLTVLWSARQRPSMHLGYRLLYFWNKINGESSSNLPQVVSAGVTATAIPGCFYQKYESPRKIGTTALKGHNEKTAMVPCTGIKIVFWSHPASCVNSTSSPMFGGTGMSVSNQSSKITVRANRTIWYISSSVSANTLLDLLLLSLFFLYFTFAAHASSENTAGAFEQLCGTSFRSAAKVPLTNLSLNHTRRSTKKARRC